jgi:hypothetical protein
VNIRAIVLNADGEVLINMSEDLVFGHWNRYTAGARGRCVAM